MDAKVTCSSGDATSLKSVPMAVYDKNDIVSGKIRQSGTWEADESRRISDALGNAASARASGNATFVDIGMPPFPQAFVDGLRKYLSRQGVIRRQHDLYSTPLYNACCTDMVLEMLICHDAARANYQLRCGLAF